MTPVKFKLECEACGLGFVVTYDAEVPAAILQLDCKCGHTTRVKQTPHPLERFDWHNPVIESALRKLGSTDTPTMAPGQTQTVGHWSYPTSFCSTCGLPIAERGPSGMVYGPGTACAGHATTGFELHADHPCRNDHMGYVLASDLCAKCDRPYSEHSQPSVASSLASHRCPAPNTHADPSGVSDR